MCSGINSQEPPLWGRYLLSHCMSSPRKSLETEVRRRPVGNVAGYSVWATQDTQQPVSFLDVNRNMVRGCFEREGLMYDQAWCTFRTVPLLQQPLTGARTASMETVVVTPTEGVKRKTFGRKELGAVCRESYSFSAFSCKAKTWGEAWRGKAGKIEAAAQRSSGSRRKKPTVCLTGVEGKA